MNRTRARELLPIIEAFANGEDIQCRCHTDKQWVDFRASEEMECLHDVDYRIKPSPREFYLIKDKNGDWHTTQRRNPNGPIKVREVIE